MNVKYFGTSLALLVALCLPASAFAQQRPAVPASLNGSINGTVTDTEDDVIPGASISIDGDTDPRHAAKAGDTGFFEINDLVPGTYRLTVSMSGFNSWHSLDIVIKPGQDLDIPDIKLAPATVMTTVTALYTPEQIATEQVHLEEQQRVLGVIPNFYVTYEADPAPLTTKLKYQLALKTSIDPFTFFSVAAFGAIEQAGDSTGFPQGWGGYGQRVGAAYADGFSDIMLGGAIFPSLLHQDPRYYYQGTGSTGSRVFHALAAPFVCRGDNGHKQPNFSSVGGDLASAGLSNLYYPPNDRGAELVFINTGISTGGRMVNALFQEFVLRKLTQRYSKNKQQ